jgi:hypothetical protein
MARPAPRFQNHAAAISRISRRRVAMFLLALVAFYPALARAQNASSRAEAQPSGSLADSLNRANDTQLHIFYVHGMSAPGPNYSDSQELRRSICKYLKDCTSQNGQFDRREYADRHVFVLDAPTPPLSYLGQQVWSSRQGGAPSEGWNAAAPFVDHYKLLRRPPAKTIYVDEINWWPLIFAAKCRQIVAQDAALAGPSAKYIKICSTLIADDKNPKRFVSYPWIEPSEAQRLNAMPAKGARINRSLKNYVLDWGFTDAVLSVGQTRSYLIEGIHQLIEKSVDVDAAGVRGEAVVPASNQEFVIVSHSLGSYLIFSALDVTQSSPPPPWQQKFANILGHTSIVYFLANQLRLLELANLDNGVAATMVQHLNVWGQLRAQCQSSSGVLPRGDLRPELIAWSDPSDLLSWNVPVLTSVQVENREVKNATRWLWLLENPVSAHGNYDRNRHVIKAMLKPTEPGSAP